MTHYAFRNGPVEDMHANGQLSQQDMKTLNKYMVNRIAGLLSAAMDGSWLQLEQLFSYYRFFGGDWDAAEPDMGEMKLLMERLKKLCQVSANHRDCPEAGIPLVSFIYHGTL